MNLLEIKGLCKRFKEFSIENVSFTLPKGYIMGLIGPNGAGKTTTIKLILNMLKKDGGTVSVFGKDSVQDEQEIKDRIGVVLDKPYYVEDWTLRDVGKSLAPFYRKWDSAKYDALLNRFSLDGKSKVKALSRGMKMKLMIAAALSHDADFLILDEPTSGLDAVARDELMEILSDYISDEEKGVLFSTHITADLEKVADYITFIHNGKIVVSDTKDSLMDRYRLVKGGLGLLSPEQKTSIIGYREHNVGFDGLADAKDLRRLPPSLVVEPCSLDEIVVRFHKAGGNA